MENRYIVLTPEEEKTLGQLIEITEKQTDNLLRNISSELASLKFGHIHTIHPLELNQLVKEQTEAAFTFFKTKEIQWALLNGRKAAGKGLDSDFILVLVKTFEALLREHFLQEDSPVFLLARKILNTYTYYFKNGFQEEEKKQIYDEQNQLHVALLKAVNTQKDEFEKKNRQLQQAQIEALEESRNRIKTENDGRKRFLINFSHLIKSPLIGLLHSVNRLKQIIADITLPQECNEAVTYIENTSNVLSKKIGNILNIEKILLKKEMYLHDEIVPVSRIVADKVELYRNIIADKVVTMTHNIEPDLYSRIAVDALDHVLDNLLDNALRYNKFKDGTIHVECRGVVDSIVITIKDTGLGIQKKEMALLFKPYQNIIRQKQNRKKGLRMATPGMGAGLAIVKGILKEVNGTVTIESEENKGTTVTVELIRQKPNKNTRYKITENIKLSRPVSRRQLELKTREFDKKKFTLLVVDDDIDFLSITQDYLLKHFNVYLAENGFHALQMLDTIPAPDAVMIDVIMDEMDGFSFYNTISKNSNFQHIYFLFITGKPDHVEKIKALKSGAIDYICKPFSLEEFAYKLKAILGKRLTVQKLMKQMLRKKLLDYLDMPERDDRPDFNKKCKEYRFNKTQMKVARYITMGLQNKEIAKKLDLSLRTINGYVYQMYKKAKVQNRVELTNRLTR